MLTIMILYEIIHQMKQTNGFWKPESEFFGAAAQTILNIVMSSISVLHPCY